jgi:predicted nucleic acid-binding protein
VIYADTSLLLPVYVPEVNSQLANEAIEGAEGLLISDLTVAEFMVGLARKVKLGELSLDRAQEVQAAFEQHMAEGFLQRLPLVGKHSEAAGELASRSPVILRTLDALHLVVAVEWEATMATLDNRLSDAARALGLAVVPEKFAA